MEALNHNKYQKPNWKRTPLPESVFPKVQGDVFERVQVDGNGVEIVPFEVAHEALFEEMAFQKNLGEPFRRYINENANHGYYIHSAGNRSEAPTVKIEYALSGKQPHLVDNFLIVVEAGSHLNVFINYSGDSETVNKQHYGTTRVIAKHGSSVRVIKIQRLGSTDHSFDQNFSIVEEGANLELIDIQFGSQTKVLAYESHLKGRHSHVDLQSLYFGEDEASLDLSYTMKHFGVKSESTILTKGALDGTSKKVFRGNLIFEKGSVQSVGREKEVVMLLGEKVKSDSIPALLCSEDDVIGEHAASIGQLDQDKIFYLMSRGLSFHAAKKMVIKASFEEVLMQIDDAGIKSMIEEALDRRLNDAFKG